MIAKEILKKNFHINLMIKHSKTLKKNIYAILDCSSDPITLISLPSTNLRKIIKENS